jgi:ubiquinone/menaquinone biosynthesis C-methylase UbiE
MRVGNSGVTLLAAASVATALSTAAPIAFAQLAGRPAADWAKTLENPTRVAALKVEEVVTMMRLRPADVVADLGAGPGLFEVALAKAVPSGRVYAVELDEGFFPHIEARVKAAGLTNVRTVKGQFTDPSLPARDVDVAFFHDVLHHVENREAYLKNLAGYLKPGARIVVVEYTAADSPHKDMPTLVVSQEQGAQLMAGIGFRPSEEHRLFTDKWYVAYRKP